MMKVLVLGGGQVTRRGVKMLPDEDAELTLLPRDASNLADAPGSARVVEGDVLDRATRPHEPETATNATSGSCSLQDGKMFVEQLHAALHHSVVTEQATYPD